MYYTKLGCAIGSYLCVRQNGGANYREIKVYGNKDELEFFKLYSNKYKRNLTERNVKITYIKSPEFKIELYGYDSELKKTIYKRDLEQLLNEIDLMPMGQIEKNIRDRFVS